MKIKWGALRKDLLPFIVRTIILIVLTIIIAILPAKGAEAAEVTLTWDANTEPDLAGYKIYFGTASGMYGVPIIIPLASLEISPEYTVPNLDPSKKWWFVVTAYDTENLESDYSNEVNTGGTYNEDGKPPAKPTGLKAWWQRLISWLFGTPLKIKSVG